MLHHEKTGCIATRHYVSPCGTLLLGDYQGKLCLCDWLCNARRTINEHRICRLLHAKYVEKDTELLSHALVQLQEYFAGERTCFDLPFLLVGSNFQCQVWNALQEIAYGKTKSYKDVALHLGKDKAVRAVANAVGANAVSIIVPCHRVIGADGSPTGYAGGLHAKKLLLALETHGTKAKGKKRENLEKINLK